jgi:hypothetical protein
MRELTSHKASGLNKELRVTVYDEPGPGGSCHHYEIHGPTKQVSGFGPVPETSLTETEIHFQKGPIQECGVNGISNEALLAIVEDRLWGFQSGQFACAENANALIHVRQALGYLLYRTRERTARGVEGTMQK